VEDIEAAQNARLLAPHEILREMVAATEWRGGQAGGIAAFEFSRDRARPPTLGRVRKVARKRFPLADDLVRAFRCGCPTGSARRAELLSVIGHRRFATSSINCEPELHPHDWFLSGFADDVDPTMRIGFLGHLRLEHLRTSPMERARAPERVHAWDADARALVPRSATVVINVTHNGDFDALSAYGGLALNRKLGFWLEHVLQQRNSARGDSPKLAGMLELLRVQGRWGAAVRLA
jgi:hypothetical protein